MELTLPERPIPDEHLSPAKVAVILVTAADLIAREGLHKGDWWEYDRHHPGRWSPGHRLCPVGAIGIAAGYRTDAGMREQVIDLFADEPDVHPALKALMKWLGVERIEDVFAWSDDAHDAEEPERVIETLRAIAAGLGAA